MGVEGVKCPLGFFRAEPKVSHPTPEIEVGLGEHSLEGVAPIAGDKLPDLTADPLIALLRWPNSNAPMVLAFEPKTKEGRLIRLDHAALAVVDLETQAPLDKTAKRRHHPCPSALTADKNEEVVRIAHVTQAPSCQLPIELIEHDIRKERREWAPLRRTLLIGYMHAIAHGYLCLEHHPDETQDTAIRNLRLDAGQKALVMNPVEGLLDRLPTTSMIFPTT
jgi:hypothetical protein